MTGQRTLRSAITILIAGAGLLMAPAGQAMAATAGGLTILHASADAEAHKCNIIGGANTKYEAVVCDDLMTYEGASDYYVYDRAETYCQVTATGAAIACKSIAVETNLMTGDDATDYAGAACGAAGGGSCPTGRMYTSSRNWDYSIANAGGGTCSSNVNSSYQVYGEIYGDDTVIETPGGQYYGVDNGNANDGVNESSGHYFVCP